tara:strand:- start:5004 stop:5816 length:813 start_codon:yes stop_codon:yes gene_type:complete
MDITKVKLGTDPELFIANDTEVISAEGLIGGTKKSPKFITDEGHAVQEDNVMVEFNIPPCSSADEFTKEINVVLTYLEATLGLQNLRLHYSASEVLDPKYLQTKQAQEFGCEPDFNAYLRCANTPPEANSTLRTAGGHIHVGYPNTGDVGQVEDIVRAMDLFLGLPSIIMDEDNRRKTMYGKAGAFRFKDYGLEYRTLSNFWIYTDELKAWAFNSTIAAIKFVSNTDNREKLYSMGDKIQTAINNNDKYLAIDLMANVAEIKRINLKEKV